MGSPALLKMPHCEVATFIETLALAGITVEPGLHNSSGARLFCRRDRTSFVLDLFLETNQLNVVFSADISGWRWWNLPWNLWQWFKRRSDEMTLQSDVYQALKGLGAKVIDGGGMLKVTDSDHSK